MPRKTAPSQNQFRREICLIGQPPLHRHLDFVKGVVVDGETLSRKTLTDAWRAANDHYEVLETSEAGVADQATCVPLTAAQQKLTAKVRADVRFRKTFDTMPTEICMVELAKLVIYQTRVDEEHVLNLAKRLRPKPNLKALIEFCFPLEVSAAPIDIARVGPRRYVFSSPSTDFRFQNPMLLQPENITGIETSGPIVGLAGVPVGFGSNLFSVIRSGTRMLLHNGYHRACAMLEAGITHAPCIVQTVTRQDELDVAAKAEVAEKTDFYFRSVRPPLLKDFVDPKIRRVFTVKRMKRVIEVNFDIREFTVPL